MEHRGNAALLLGLVGVVVFGGTLPATRLAVATLDPIFVAAGRALVAGLCAAAILIVLRRPLPDRRHWRTIALIALALVAGFPLFATLAMLYAPASHGAVVLGALPLATAVAGTVLGGERPSRRFWMFAIVGALLVCLHAVTGIDDGFALGDLALLASVASAALGYALSGVLSRILPGWEVICWALVFSLPVALPITLLVLPADFAAPGGAAWAAFAYLSVMSQLVGFFAWNRALALGGIARVGQTQLLQTFVTLGLAAVLLGERISPFTLALAVAVVAVVALGQRARIGARTPAS